MTMRVSEKVLDRFWAKIDDSGGSSACWPWLGHKVKTKYGEYGIFKFRRENWYSHRFLWAILHKRKLEDELVLHSGSVHPACCNQTHLFLGTPHDVQQFILRRDRHGQLRKTHCSHGHPYSGKNLIVGPDSHRSHRICRTCHRKYQRRSQRKYRRRRRIYQREYRRKHLKRIRKYQREWARNRAARINGRLGGRPPKKGKGR